MGKKLSIYDGQKVFIEEQGDTRRIMRVRTDSHNFKHGEVMAVPREFKKLSTDEKREALQAMADDGLPRTDMAYYTGLSESRISQLIGKKRKSSEKDLYVTFESNTL